MNYSIKLDSENKIIKVEVTCLLNQDIRKTILLDITRNLLIHKYSKVLIDLTKSTFNPNEYMVGAIELAQFMENLGIPPHTKFAFIYSEAEEHRKYFESVAQEDGFNLRYFKDPAKAYSWLNRN